MCEHMFQLTKGQYIINVLLNINGHLFMKDPVFSDFYCGGHSFHLKTIVVCSVMQRLP